MPQILLALFAVLQIADVCTTALVIRAGAGREGNPVVAALIAGFGLVPGLLIAKALLLPLWWMLGAYSWLLGVLCAFYLAVVVNNYQIWKRHG